MKHISMAILGAAVLAAGLTGCSKSTGITRISGTSVDGMPNTGPVRGATPTSPGKPKGATATISVDGKTVQTDAPTRCSPGPDHGVFITIGKVTDDRGVILKGDPPTVDAVNLGDVNGTRYIYIESLPHKGEVATATKDGDRYTVEGTIMGFNKSSMKNAGTKPFRVDAACPR
ncbi:lipoprotein LpqH [Mycobacterium sp. NPDC050853]|uniref:lipoprotein LpqH n=1 Tax=Mycobacteriaceae TaxID=1762 RepID=UPI0015DDA6A6|nr:lipoprotein LpqH [Mycobacteroides sp. LB1]